MNESSAAFGIRALAASTWARGTAFALMFAMSVTRAWSQGIIHIVPSQPINYSAGFLDSETDIDINNDGIPDFGIISTSSYDADITPLDSNSIVAWPEPPPDLGYFVWAFDQGEAIGPSLDPSLQWYDNQSDQFGRAAIGAQALFDNQLVVLGYFAEKSSAYVGFNLVASGTNYYGWMQISNPADMVYGQIVDWAFETSPNTPIKAGQTSEPIYFEATFNGGNEVPPNKSTHSGSGSFELESYVYGYILTYNLQLDGTFQPTSAGIYGPATPMMNARFHIANLGAYSISNLPPPLFPPIEPVPFDLRHPKHPILQPISWPSVLIYDGQINLSSNQVTELLTGQLYVNFKSAKFRQGELRGEIWPTAPIQFSATLRTCGGSPRKPSAQYGEASFTLSGATLAGNVALDTNIFWNSMGIYASPIVLPNTLVATLTNVLGVLIPDGGFPGHPDWPGLPGQVLYPEWATLTDRQVSQLKNGQLYLQVRTSRFRNGEIGGRILPAE